jgi:hypothetical protein
MLTGKREGKRPAGKSGNKWDDNINTDLKDTEYEGVACMSRLGYVELSGCNEYACRVREVLGIFAELRDY